MRVSSRSSCSGGLPGTSRTGTIRARAVLDNKARVFTPGLFARVQLEGSGQFKAMLIDDKAVLTDQDRKYVFVVGEGDPDISKNPVLRLLSRRMRVTPELHGQRFPGVTAANHAVSERRHFQPHAADDGGAAASVQIIGGDQQIASGLIIRDLRDAVGRNINRALLAAVKHAPYKDRAVIRTADNLGPD